MTARRAKPECPLDSESLTSRLHDLSRIRIVDRWRLIGLVFWVRRPVIGQVGWRWPLVTRPAVRSPKPTPPGVFCETATSRPRRSKYGKAPELLPQSETRAWMA
jgi:hypothetical protein